MNGRNKGNRRGVVADCDCGARRGDHVTRVNFPLPGRVRVQWRRTPTKGIESPMVMNLPDLQGPHS